MSPVVVKNGKLLVKDGKLATNENCCCCTCQCCSNDSLTIDFDIDAASNCDHIFSIVDGCIISYQSNCANATNITVNNTPWNINESSTFKLSTICKGAIVPFEDPTSVFGCGLYTVININNAVVNPIIAAGFCPPIVNFPNPPPIFTVTPQGVGHVSFTITWNCPTPFSPALWIPAEDRLDCGQPCEGPPITVSRTITMADGSKC